MTATKDNLGGEQDFVPLHVMSNKFSVSSDHSQQSPWTAACPDFPAIDLQIYRAIMLSLLAGAGVESPPITIKLLRIHCFTLFLTTSCSFSPPVLLAYPFFSHIVLPFSRLYRPLSHFFLTFPPPLSQSLHPFICLYPSVTSSSRSCTCPALFARLCLNLDG